MNQLMCLRSLYEEHALQDLKERSVGPTDRPTFAFNFT